MRGNHGEIDHSVGCGDYHNLFRFRPIVAEHPGKEWYFSQGLFLFFAKGIVLMKCIHSLKNKGIIIFVLVTKCSVDLHVKSSSV